MKTNQPYTLGIWTVKPGNEAAFIAEWGSFAQWSSKNQRGADTAYLLQDSDRPQQFISFGGWESPENIKEWRGRPEFQAFVSKARPLCEEFQPHSMKLVAVAGQ